MVDTRAGLWLLISIAALTALALIIQLCRGRSPRTRRLLQRLRRRARTSRMGFLLPVLGIMLVTSEWSQRTAMVTFALEPSRSRGDPAAKLVAALLVGLSPRS